jgi:hypothetical protein
MYFSADSQEMGAIWSSALSYFLSLPLFLNVWISFFHLSSTSSKDAAACAVWTIHFERDSQT